MNFAKKVGRPTIDAAVELTRRITDVATQVFLQKGYAKTGMEEISAASGVAKRSLYSRFPSKSMLFCQVMRSYADRAFEGLDCSRAENATLEQQLRMACLQILQALMQADVATMERIITGEAVQFPELAQSVMAAEQRVVEQFAAILRHSVQCTGLTEQEYQAAASSLLHLVVSPEIRKVTLAIIPCEVTPAMEQRVAHEVTLFLHGFVRMHGPDACEAWLDNTRSG